MSDIRDEIDWEFPGSNTTQGQTNYFWQGYIRSSFSPLLDITSHYLIATTTNNGKVETVSSDSYSNYHDYTVCLFDISHSRRLTRPQPIRSD